jgi:hypothetical protein
MDIASRSRRLFRARFAIEFPPSAIRGRRECRAPDAPAAARVVVESTRVSHHGHTENTRHSPRNGFNGFLRALPGDRACLPPSSLRSLLLKNLMPASGHQDHTTSPSASSALVRSAVRVHRIPPHVRDDRETPLDLGRDGLVYCCFYRTEKRKIFRERAGHKNCRTARRANHTGLSDPCPLFADSDKIP